MRLGEKETDKHNLYYSMGAIFPDGDTNAKTDFIVPRLLFDV